MLKELERVAESESAGYFTHFAGLWVCNKCGHLCECEGE